MDFIGGFCRKGNECAKSHDICGVPDNRARTPPLNSLPNFLSLEPRALPRQEIPFESDGPGQLSIQGPRHDNDYVEIQRISILPTTDEILCRRRPYMPEKDQSARHHLPCGQQRLLDVEFRQLRYDNVEPIIDCCYHACQQLTAILSEPEALDYDHRMVTPKNIRYSLFRDATFEEQIFSFREGVTFRLSFACPRALRGRKLGPSNHLEEGMLVALIGCEEAEVSITFMQISQRQTTEAMRPRTGNDLRASVVLSLANTGDTGAVRRLLYNSQGLLSEKFVLLELPNALYAGFYWTLKQLQSQSANKEELAFVSSIAPTTAGTSPVVSLPEYAATDGFCFQLDALRTNSNCDNRGSLTLRPIELVSDDQSKFNWIDTICRETTLDRGQATALCENLCRGFAFTQGPPGTGKTFLGVSLTKVLLASRGHASRRPILVVCTTNHALDSFLEDLRDAGISKLARLGSNSKEAWTKQFSLHFLTRSLRKTTLEKDKAGQSRRQVEG